MPATPIARVLAARIAQKGPISFRDYMAACGKAYYDRGPRIGGAGADFHTAASFDLFARALARHVEDVWEALSRPDPFRIVELGGGTGELAEGLRRALRGPCEVASRFVLVERSDALRKAQADRGFEAVASLRDLPPAPTALLANEVLDALPVHRVRGTPEGPREVYVDVKAGQVVEVLRPVSEALAADLARHTPPPVGRTLELRPDVRALLVPMAAAMTEGCALFLDYGEEGPDHRGTVATYRAHTRGENPYAFPGEEDLTADVDFAAVRVDATEAGFDVHGVAPQGRFLAGLGLLEEAAASKDPLEMQRAKTLVVPAGMGERFKVLAVSKGLGKVDLRGFRRSW